MVRKKPCQKRNGNVWQFDWLRRIALIISDRVRSFKSQQINLHRLWHIVTTDRNKQSLLINLHRLSHIVTTARNKQSTLINLHKLWHIEQRQRLVLGLLFEKIEKPTAAESSRGSHHSGCGEQTQELLSGPLFGH
jgi:hypothetical protein